mmetsp:Transcript_65843/g.80574  ORF Transcript_65843/g.80574 Transcript_65843/m.80574 type:complete len:220 (+) Transcript_65843:181-840(+)
MGSMHSIVASRVKRCAINQISDVRRIDGWWQFRARRMRIGSNVLRVVDGVTGPVHGCAIRQVANIVHKDSTRQGRAWRMRVWANVFRVVDGIAGSVHWGAIWQVTHVIAKGQVRISILLHCIEEAGGNPLVCSTSHAGRCSHKGSSHWLHCRGRSGSTLHRKVACNGHVSAIHQVSKLRSIVGSWQRGARCVHVRLHGLGVVQGIAGCIQWCAVRQVSH